MLQSQVEEEEDFDECQAAHADKERQVSAGRHQSLDEAVDELALVDDFGLHHRPGDARVVEPEHRVRSLHGIFEVVAVGGA